MIDFTAQDEELEQLAAYLDGNMTTKEMQDMSESIRQDVRLQRVLEMCDEVDADMEKFVAQSSALPDNMSDPDLKLPDLEEYKLLEMINGKKMAEVGMVAAACAPPQDGGLLSRVREWMDSIGQKDS